MNVKKRILLVDDDPDFLYQLNLQLTEAGFDVTTAGSKQEADELLTKNRPDLAIVDLMMEHLDAGFTLCHNIKKLDKAIPVIILTGVAHETGLDFNVTTDEEWSWVEADAILAKPIRFEQLQREIARLLKE